MRESAWGQLYEVEIQVEGLNGRVRPLTTVWLVAVAGQPPVLVTAYVGDLDRGA